MTEQAYLGLDLGGTGAKAGVFDHTGKLLGFGKAACTPTISSEGRAEIPIEDVVAAAREATLAAIKHSDAEIRALSISSQGQTFVSLDADDRPLHPAIIWYDSRAAEQAERMKAGVKSEPVPVIEAIATAPKIMWLRENCPEVMSRARRFLLLPDYFTNLLTGEAVIDPATASSTALYADDAPGYSREALRAAEIDESQVARIQPSGSLIGRALPEVARNWGLSPDTLLVTGTNDQYAGALGAGNCRPGVISETTGTCLALVTLTDKRVASAPEGLWIGRFPITCYQFALAYAKTAGVVLEWFNRQFCPDKSLLELDEMAGSIPIGANGLTVLPHFDGMVSPKPNPNAKGFFCNITLGHTQADVYRAILESLTFSLRENVEFLAANGFPTDTIRSIGGGAKSDFWSQMKADVVGLPVERPAVTEAATLGAAMLAAVGAGDFASLDESSQRLYKAERVFHPNLENHASYESAYRAYLGMCRRAYEGREG